MLNGTHYVSYHHVEKIHTVVVTQQRPSYFKVGMLCMDYTYVGSNNSFLPNKHALEEMLLRRLNKSEFFIGSSPTYHMLWPIK